MGLSYSPSPEEIRQREIDQLKEQINYQREQVYKNLLLELYEIKDNCPNTLVVEKEDCGRPTYIMNNNSKYYCPKCGGGVQLFIENKLVKVLNIRNKIYPLYSDYACFKNPKPILLNKSNKPTVEILSDEKGEKYFFVNGNKYYLTAHAIFEYGDKITQEYASSYLWFIISDHNYRNREERDFVGNYGYDFYEYQNPLRNNDSKSALKYYRCVKCHLEYHLYSPYYSYYLKYIKSKGEEKDKEDIKDENLGNENKKELGKDVNANNENGNENQEKKMNKFIKYLMIIY